MACLSFGRARKSRTTFSEAAPLRTFDDMDMMLLARPIPASKGDSSSSSSSLHESLSGRRSSALGDCAACCQRTITAASVSGSESPDALARLVQPSRVVGRSAMLDCVPERCLQSAFTVVCGSRWSARSYQKACARCSSSRASRVGMESKEAPEAVDAQHPISGGRRAALSTHGALRVRGGLGAVHRRLCYGLYLNSYIIIYQNYTVLSRV